MFIDKLGIEHPYCEKGGREMEEILNADIILKNGQIYSVDLSEKLSISQAMAVKDGKIIFVGSDDYADKFYGENTEVIDLCGKTVLPGFVDSHIHPSSTAEIINDFNVSHIMEAGIQSREEAITELQKEIKKNSKLYPDAEILRGVGWDASFFASTSEGMPTCADIDEICSEIPVIMRSFCHHYIWVNSKALEVAGIDEHTPTPRNGVIVRDEEARPTGVFQETTAMDLLMKSIPNADYSLEQYKDAILSFQKQYANEFGTTLVFDAYPSKRAIEAYHELAKDGMLTIRVSGCFYADPSEPFEQFDRFIDDKSKYDVDDVFSIKTVKFFVDGSGFSFLLNEPFEPDALKAANLPEEYVGSSQWTLEELKKAFEKINNAGMQIHAHCMGDGAVSMVINALEYVAEKSDIKSNRHVVAHILGIKEQEMHKLADMGIIAAMQPSWCKMAGVQDRAALLIGEERRNASYPIGKLKKAGVMITSGTDFPVYIPPNPFEGIQVGITRKIHKKHPEYERYKGIQLGSDSNKMSLEEMIQSYCINGAYQCFLENVTGTLESGKSADFVILNRKITDVEESQIIDLFAESVYFKGKKVK